LVLFGGKGGVGKTTCAVAAALHSARAFPLDNFLLVSTDPAHCLRHCLAGEPPANLQLLEVDAAASLARFKEDHGQMLREIALRGTPLSEEEVRQFFDLSLPGVDELMAFQEITARMEGGSFRTVLVDTAPMGHTLRLLGLFEVMRRWFGGLDAMLAKHRYLTALYRGTDEPNQVDAFLAGMERSLGRLASLLRDQRACLFVPVLLAEHLSVLQTRRLLDELGKLRVPVADLVVNRVFPANTTCPVCRAGRRQQDEYIRRIEQEFAGHRLWQLPLRGAEVRGAERLTSLWDEFSPLQAQTWDAPADTPPQRVEQPLPLPNPEVRLLLIAGKGGVGKTTVACATALRLAEANPGKEVLLISTDPDHSLAGCLGLPVGSQEVRVCAGLTAVEVDAAAEFARLKTLYADEIGQFFGGLSRQHAVSLEFDREGLENVLDLTPPGLDEVMALTRVAEMVEAGGYDIFVLDTAPSGHFIRLLEMPQLIQDWLKVLFGVLLKYRSIFRLPRTSELLVGLSKGIKALQSLLEDPRRGQVFAVSILTQLAFEKTAELLAATRKSGIVTSALILNLATAPAPCPLCTDLAEAEAQVCRRFREAFAPLAQPVVYRCGELRGLDRLRKLGRALYDNDFSQRR
jgi:arsenite-transporting ATPase